VIVAVVPLKRLLDGKSRLSSVLSAEEREEIMLRLVTRTIGVLRASEEIERIAVVTPEMGLPERIGVEAVVDRGTLNASLGEGIVWAEAVRAERLLIVPADLPLLDAADVRALVAAARSSPGLVLAPTRDGGTGALLATPPRIAQPAFGRDSCRRHRESAEQRGVPVRIVQRFAFSFDLDTVEDLRTLQGFGK
jgi:2-phospho-L-lactate guanylyltransferase